MNRTQKLLEVARWVYPHVDWMAGTSGQIISEDAFFSLSNYRDRQAVTLKLREHNWKIEQRKNYWLGLKVDATGRTEIKKATFEDLVWDLVGRVG